jgi:hypothetical protein
MAGRILNFEKVIVETVTVAVNGGPTWELRDDVPAGTLAMAFRVFDLERQMASPQALPAAAGQGQGQGQGETAEPQQAEPLTVAQEAQILDEAEAATLDAVTAIVRHSYPAVTRAEVADALTPAARGRVLQVFFPLLLARFGRLSPTSPDATPATPATPTTSANRAQRRGQGKKAAGTAAGTDATTSPRS